MQNVEAKDEKSSANNDDAQDESALDRVRSRRRARKRKKRMKWLVPLCVVVVALLATYGGGVWYFSSRYYPNTTVASVDASLKTEGELAQAIDAAVQSYEVTASDGSFSFATTADQVALQKNGAELAAQVRSRMHVERWPFELMAPRDYADVQLRFDDARLAPAIAEAVAAYNKTATQPQNATMEFDDATGLFVLNDEVPGSAMDEQRVHDAVSAAIGQARREVTLDAQAHIQPDLSVGDPKLQEALTKANAALDLAVPLQFHGTTLATPTHADMTGWIGVNDDLSVKVRKGLFARWAEQEGLWLSVDYNDDKQDYVGDGRALAGLLQDALNAGSTAPIEVPLKGVARYSGVDAGAPEAVWNEEEGRYLDVDIAHQTARFFSATGDVIWESVVTTGNVAAGHATPQGSFAIYDKKTDFILLGEDQNGDGSYDYEWHVDFWMPFNEGIGLHDAYWRDSFGGDNYLESGSGGCVNLPKDAAAALYEMIHVGDKVIVHE